MRVKRAKSPSKELLFGVIRTGVGVIPLCFSEQATRVDYSAEARIHATDLKVFGVPLSRCSFRGEVILEGHPSKTPGAVPEHPSYARIW